MTSLPVAVGGARLEPNARVVALSGGVGGARLVAGLAAELAPEQLKVVVNTADDFQHWGLHIAPDLDTVMYTLAGLAPRERGWGVVDETYSTFAEMTRRGAADWFQLGDRDLATHLARTRALRGGATLTEATRSLFEGLGLPTNVLPMSDEAAPTSVETDVGALDFQEWLVRRRATPVVSEVRCAANAHPSEGVLASLREATLVVVTPSNPFVSIAPILALPGVRRAIGSTPVVSVNPLIGGRAVKGPLGAMFPSIRGRAASAGAIVAEYRDHLVPLSGILVAPGDLESAQAESVALAVRERDIMLVEDLDRIAVARDLLALGAALLERAS